MARHVRVLCGALAIIAGTACNSDSSGPGDGGNPLPPGIGLQLNSFIPGSSGLVSPVFLTQPLDDGRIFVVERIGRIRVVRDGVLQATPFLDISNRVASADQERGLLSVAFHPQYATNHFFYVYFTTQGDNQTVNHGDIRVERFIATSNPEVANPASTKLIITIPHSANNNHNGGLLTFGSDGMLYAGVGDGGGGGDPGGNGQNFNSLLGSLLRLDVDHGDPYAIPADNPFASTAGRRGEIWAKGLRNPWRYSFDATTSLLYIADVGQNLHEEVDVVPTTSAGLNYGWNVWEGLSCYSTTTCSSTGFQAPILDYGHGPACSITGGYVYRGSAIPAIRGHYFYSDYCAGFLRSFRYENGTAVDEKDWELPSSLVVSFGRDFAGELYVIAGDNSIRKIAPVP